ncbi:MAG: hypothetical protein IPJ26_11830 [Bacteroidetes bacterium]|jgi:hypothetical protein|nr:hypothetical protein [Bacteroidota bacterium]
MRNQQNTMKDTTRLFGKSTKKDWMNLRIKITGQPDEENNWKAATNLLKERLESRYFRPINKILNMRLTTGEGFAAMTLICSLIEFLQSCYEGKSYIFKAAESKLIYGNSGDKFKSFLKLQEPFKTVFNKSVRNPTKEILNYADDFYINVRCGLLHEAATNNGWVIKSRNSISNSKVIVDVSDEANKIIFRDEFFRSIKNYSDLYLKNIIANKNDFNEQSLRDNFCRKMDSLCYIDGTSENWWT